MLLHKWSGNKKALAHSVAPWQPHEIFICFCETHKDASFRNPYKDVMFPLLKKNQQLSPIFWKLISLIWAVDTQLFMLLFNCLIIPSTLAVFQQSLVSFCRRAFISAQRVPLVLSPLSSLIKGSELEA